eukprot:CAMPEP_0196576020 /NCGR_PEP_ID=MMETSP1081-20130531/5388_1 /TAXON_ID=36882 /ORGANISM="Pyramimonas amylifera, Strain CCMP720" /LENGTH=246 /DNA_ID=CAMNT_0041894507 /DNA_START=35 /DNA_END=772 /DNA_ORIENTATION=+
MSSHPSKLKVIEEFQDIIDKKQGSPRVFQKFLRAVRDEKVRRSELVVKCGETLINSGILGAEELWMVHEQVCIAALDVQDHALALRCIQKLANKFPESVRVGRLRGMALEGAGKWAEAGALYDRLLEKNSTNGPIIKRKAALERSQGNFKAAVDRLNDYLTVFMADVEAWAELADIYLENEMYQQAAFCMEELVVAAPHNYLFHLRYAEILYTWGGAENLRLALKYFSAAVELTTGACLRALTGMW